VENGLDLQLIVQQLFANQISAFFGFAVIVSAIVLILFIYKEGTGLGMGTCGCLL
jgi:hypothetical protein